ncbi:MAG: alkaline phosphatase family protein, partial [Anaerolineae bacterium]
MKTLIIGLDGATFTVLNPLLKAGYMPHLRQALERSATATLLSTIPPVTALAWPSFMTGKNPGRHGLLGWQGPLNAHFDRPWISGQAVRGVKLWQWANRAGLSAVVVNVPVTYPPQPLDGAMVTGMLTPGLTAGFTFPPQLKRDLLAAVPGYTIDVDIQHTERNLQTPDAAARFLNQNMALARARGAAARWLLERYRPDLGVVVFGLTDRLQHFFWRPITRLAAAGADDGTVSATLLACFQTLDDEIGQLLAGLPQTAHLIFLSDHGFGPLNTLVHLNHWLAERGWLAFSRGRSGGREALRRAGRLVRRWLPATVMRRARQNFSVLRTLDWGRTVA